MEKEFKITDEMADEALRLDNQLCFPLYAASRRIISAYTPFLKPLGLTYTQYIVFLVLWEKDGITVGEIGERLRLDNGTLTPLLKKMEKAGYVSRERSSKDERVVLITLTKDGKAMKKKAREIPFQVGSCLCIDPKEAKQLKEMLDKLLTDDTSSPSVK